MTICHFRINWFLQNLEAEVKDFSAAILGTRKWNIFSPSTLPSRNILQNSINIQRLYWFKIENKRGIAFNGTSTDIVLNSINSFSDICLGPELTFFSPRLIMCTRKMKKNLATSFTLCQSFLIKLICHHNKLKCRGEGRCLS